MTRNSVRLAICMACMTLLGLLGVIGASATSSVISPALNSSELYSMSQGVEDQLDLQKPISYYAYYPVAITNTSIADQDFRYYVYVVYSDSVRVDSFTPYVSITLSASTVIYRFDYDMFGAGLNSMSYIGNASAIPLADNETVALYLPELGGWSYGDPTTIGSSSVNREGLAYEKWLNAMEGYQGVWNGTTIAEKVENARNQGYTAGLDVGKEEGYAKAEKHYKDIIERVEDTEYDRGWNEAMDQYRTTGVTAYWLDIGKIITSYTDGIANIFQSITNFELFGINIAGVFGAIIAVLVLGFVVSLVLKLFGLLI